MANSSWVGRIFGAVREHRTKTDLRTEQLQRVSEECSRLDAAAAVGKHHKLPGFLIFPVIKLHNSSENPGGCAPGKRF